MRPSGPCGPRALARCAGQCMRAQSAAGEGTRRTWPRYWRRWGRAAAERSAELRQVTTDQLVADLRRDLDRAARVEVERDVDVVVQRDERAGVGVEHPAARVADLA